MNIKKSILCASMAAAQLLSVAGMGITASAAGEASTDTIAVGADHSLVIRSDMSLWAAGDNSYGQLGVGAATKNSAGVKVMSGVIYAAANDCTSFAISSDGALYGWGDNSDGQINPESAEKMIFSPTKIMENVASVSVGDTHTVAIKTDGSVYGWGSNDYGELVSASTSKKGFTLLHANAIDTAAGDGFTAIVTADGALYVCGNNENGQLGIGAYNDLTSLYLAVDKGVKSVAAGNNHIVVLMKDGTVHTAGLNDSGQLGVGDTRTRSKLIKTDLKGIESIFAGGNSSGAVGSNGKLYTWGENAYGQLQNNKTENSTEPVSVMSNTVSVAFGEHHSVSLNGKGEISAAGSGAYGELFTAVSGSVLKPERVLDDVVQFSAGADHAAAITSDGTLYTWGNNDCGQLGLGDYELRNKPTAVMLYDEAKKVWCGDKITFVLTEDEKVYVFGDNSAGLLGVKTRGNRVCNPTENDALSGFDKLDIQPSDGFCIALADGDVLGWGKNTSSRLLDLGSNVTTPTAISHELSDISAIAAGSNHCLAIDSAGTLLAWGSNSKKQLAYDTERGYSDHAVECEKYYDNENSSTVLAIAADGNHSMALDENGRVWVWGENSFCQLGTAYMTRVEKPYMHVRTCHALDASDTACGIITDEGELMLAGSNKTGALGTGDIEDINRFGEITGTDATALSLGDGFGGYIRGDGALCTWGNNSYGQTGNGEGGMESDTGVVIKDALCGAMIEPDGISLNMSEMVVKPGTTAKLTATLQPANVNLKNITWSSSNKSVATVDADGNVKGIAKGSAVITAKTANGLTAKCSVTVAVPVSSFSVYPGSKTMNVGSSFNITSKVYPSSATDKTLLFSSSDTSVVKVDAKGKVTAVGAGMAKITATAKTNTAKTRTITVWVRPESVKITERKSTADGIYIEWEKSENADGYIIVRQIGVDGKMYSVGEVSADTLSFTHSKVVKGTQYYYGVRPYTVVDGKRILGSLKNIYGITAR